MRERSDRQFVRVAALTEVPVGGSLVVRAGGHTIALFHTAEGIFAVDNRCPHMGFPLDRGSVKDCILTCHWHHARFDLNSGGTFDQFADDVRAFPTRIEGGEVWIDLTLPAGARTQQLYRLRDGLERDIPLVMGKSVIR